LTRDLYS